MVLGHIAVIQSSNNCYYYEIIHKVEIELEIVSIDESPENGS